MKKLTEKQQFILDFVNGKTNWITTEHKTGEVKQFFENQKIGDYVVWMFNEYPFNWIHPEEKEINFNYNSLNFYVLKPGKCFTMVFPENQIKKNYYQLVMEYKTKNLPIEVERRNQIVREYLPR